PTARTTRVNPARRLRYLPSGQWPPIESWAILCNMLIAQITDTHIKPQGALAYGRIDTAAYLARAVEHLLGLRPRPDLVLATGDLVDSGRPDEYRRLHDLLAPLSMPVYLIPGNHDDRDALGRVPRTCLPPAGRSVHAICHRGLPRPAPRARHARARPGRRPTLRRAAG